MLTGKKRLHKIEIARPFIVGKLYATRFASGEGFFITQKEAKAFCKMIAKVIKHYKK
jgi:hypothetical protein